MRKLIIAFSFLWIILVLLEYVNKHPIHVFSFQYFKLYGLAGTIAVLTAGAYLLDKFVLRPREINLYRGGILFGLASIIGYASLYLFITKLDNSGTVSTIIPLLNSWASFAAVMVLLVSVHSLGELIRSKLLKYQISESSFRMLDIALGFTILTGLMFALGIFGFLNAIVLAILVLLPIGINYKVSFNFVKTLFYDPIADSKTVSGLSMVLGIFLISYFAFNIIYTQAPFPPGFDSRNYYLNISQLISQNNGLVEGFQPYNWSLLLSYGFVIFKSAPISFGVSTLSLVLAMFAVHEIMTNYFKLSNQDSLLVVAAFAMTPAVCNQLFVEIKIDFGLLFFQLVSIILLLNLFNKKSFKNLAFAESKNTTILLVLLGVFTGFALGIKLTHLYLVFGIAGLIWFLNGRMKGFFGIFALSMFFIFFTKFDDISGLSQYHLGKDTYKWALLIIGLGFLGMFFKENKKGFMLAMKNSLIYGLVTAFTFAPWMVKNMSDSNGKPSVNKILMGNNPGPNITLKKVDYNLRKSIQDNK